MGRSRNAIHQLAHREAGGSDKEFATAKSDKKEIWTMKQKPKSLQFRCSPELDARVREYAAARGLSLNKALNDLVEMALTGGELVAMVRKEFVVCREQLAAERYAYNMARGMPAVVPARSRSPMPCPEATGFGPKAGVWPFDQASSQNGNEPWPA